MTLGGYCLLNMEQGKTQLLLIQLISFTENIFPSLCAHGQGAYMRWFTMGRECLGRYNDNKLDCLSFNAPGKEEFELISQLEYASAIYSKYTKV